MHFDKSAFSENQIGGGEGDCNYLSAGAGAYLCAFLVVLTGKIQWKLVYSLKGLRCYQICTQE